MFKNLPIRNGKRKLHTLLCLLNLEIPPAQQLTTRIADIALNTITTHALGEFKVFLFFLLKLCLKVVKFRGILRSSFCVWFFLYNFPRFVVLRNGRSDGYVIQSVSRIVENCARHGIVFHKFRLLPTEIRYDMSSKYRSPLHACNLFTRIINN